jgi:hypothetical protein
VIILKLGASGLSNPVVQLIALKSCQDLKCRLLADRLTEPAELLAVKEIGMSDLGSASFQHPIDMCQCALDPACTSGRGFASGFEGRKRRRTTRLG